MLLRERFWVPKTRQNIKLVLSCMLCKCVKKAQAKSFPPPPFPPERVNLARPFQVVGIDYTGAINVRDPEGLNVFKVFVCLFTCTATRSVHLELTSNMTAADFLLAFCRFSSYHSVPELIIVIMVAISLALIIF